MWKKGDAIRVLEDYLRSEDSGRDLIPYSKPGTVPQRRGSLLQGFAQLVRTQSKRHFVFTHFQGISQLMRKSRSIRESFSTLPNLMTSSLCDSKAPRISFTLSELQVATNNFSPANLIGKGGYAEVYKGVLKNGKLVAVKRLIRGTPDDIVRDFLVELGIMSHVNHPNTAKLIGYGVDGGMHLVLQLSPRGCLASLLFCSKQPLKWNIRYKVALGTAEGLLYLHEGCQRRIIHRDVKSSNILLTEDFEPQICDFGLAKWLPENWTHRSVSTFEGTFGYLAPEYLLHGIVDEKTDVFAFGVLLLELITGRKALDCSKQSLVLWAKPLMKKNDITELIDPSLIDHCNFRELNLVLLAASLCIRQTAIARPKMNQVIRILKGESGYLRSFKRCRMPALRQACSYEFSHPLSYG